MVEEAHAFGAKLVEARQYCRSRREGGFQGVLQPVGHPELATAVSTRH